MSGRAHAEVAPGRLLATMLRALAAELSDPGRFARAKAYARDGAVIDLAVRPEVVAGLVLGSRRHPYEVVLAADPVPADELVEADPARPGSMTMLVPGREELAVSCTCPDAEGWLTSAMCKHAIAVLLVLADRTSVEPSLIARWRSSSSSAAATGAASSRPEVRRLSRRGRAVSAPPTRVDILAGLLDSPVALPDLPEVDRRTPVALPAAIDDPAVRLLQELYSDAAAAMRAG